jgi:hypothetical protein
MPPRGFRDEFKKLVRKYETPEMAARGRVFTRKERDIAHLIQISILQDRDGITPHAAATKVSDAIGGDARVRHANKKRLYAKFQKAPAFYRRMAAASDAPWLAADRELCQYLYEQLGIKVTPFSDRKK